MSEFGDILQARLHSGSSNAVALKNWHLASFHDLRRNEAQLRLLRYVSEHPDASTRKIARAIGVSNGSAFYLLKALVEKGLLKVRRFTASEKKSRYIYVLTPAGVSERANLTVEFLAIKRKEYTALRDEISLMKKDIEALKTHIPNP